ncbi:hypothetical protein RLDS_09530 [Sphingobium lactosutens DS20]|uniref:HTH araC/xylS-type domain-containing protein n=3 Tax=Sphingobium TaxID=165695 RepID=T0HUW2_9SPHN|nr:hypothetical protein RLDS_09530 [Sphingobium lactosutens DS20]
MTSSAYALRSPAHLQAPDGHRGQDHRSRADHRPLLAPWQVSIAKRFMLDHLAETLHVAELARLCRLSSTYFVRAFANTVGIAPYAWFLGRRVAKAQFLLTNSAMSLAQVALECGFSDQAHFTNTFGKATGTTPARWRKTPPRPPDDWTQSP